jgi:hypothetical protein
LLELVFNVLEVTAPTVEMSLMELNSIHELKSRGYSSLVKVLEV